MKMNKNETSHGAEFFSEAVQYNIFQDFYKHIVDMSLNPYLDMAGDRIVRAKASGFPGW